MTLDKLRQFASDLRTSLSFPLLVKELTETAARRRTYVLRVVYAISLYSVFAFFLPPGTWAGLARVDYRMLGSGRMMFETLMMLQYFGVILFLPALMCGRISQEKERDSLVLLFLTELRPWSIVLQKYFGGLVTMLSFFLLGLPLAGVAYAFGGLDADTVVVSLFRLLEASLFVGALALFCSVWCRSTVEAFIMAYVVGFVLWFILSVFDSGFLLVVCTFSFLALSRRFLVARAVLPPASFLRPLFERIDRSMKRLNRFAGGVELWSDSGHLPADEPIFWRETHRRVLGRAHYLLRLLVVVELPTVTMCIVMAYDVDYRVDQVAFFSVIAAVLSGLAAMVISVQAANSIMSERVGQTLEVLLTTPLGAREIVRQKERALWRLLLIAAIPLLTVFGSEAYAENGALGKATVETWLPYLVCAILMVVIYLPMVVWLSLWISLRVRTRFQAIISAVSILTFWTALSPFLLFVADQRIYGQPGPRWSCLVLLSPVSVGYLNEFGQLDQVLWSLGSAWLTIFLNAGLYTGIALFIRWRLFADAESLLRR